MLSAVHAILNSAKALNHRDPDSPCSCRQDCLKWILPANSISHYAKPITLSSDRPVPSTFYRIYVRLSTLACLHTYSMEQNQGREALEGRVSPETFEAILDYLSQYPLSPQTRHFKEDSNDDTESPLEAKLERKDSDPRQRSDTYTVLDIQVPFANFSLVIVS
jgi:hypothetical protein